MIYHFFIIMKQLQKVTELKTQKEKELLNKSKLKKKK
jgi:hypothetical protein